jgi:MFS family permease
LKESPIFERAKNNPNLAKKQPYLTSFTTKKNLYYIFVALFGNSIGQGVSFYVSTFYALFFLQAVLFVPRTASFIIVMIATAIVWPVTVIAGHLSDKYGRRAFMIFGIVWALCSWYPVYYGLFRFGPFVNPTVAASARVINPSYSPLMLGLLLVLLGVGPGVSFGPFPAHLVELFPTSVRYTSLSVPYTIGSGVFGGLVPVVGLSMVTSSGNVFAGLWYPFIATGSTLLFLLMLVPETNHVDIEGDEDLEKTWFLKTIRF